MRTSLTVNGLTVDELLAFHRARFGDARMEDGGDGSDDGQDDKGGDGFKPITSQEDLNRVIAERVKREQAKFADYKDVKAKAARLDEIEAANKTEAQKLADAKAEAERERDQARAESLRLRVAAKHGISDEDADLFLTGTDEVTLTKQAERLAQRAEDRKKQGNVVRREGANPTKPADEVSEFARGLFSGE